MNSPTKVAADIAAQLRADPIAAAQIHEHIPASELLDLLDLRAAMAEHVEEMVEQKVADKDEEIRGYQREIARLNKELSNQYWSNPPTQ
jgi:Na+/phosphate symporter